MPGINPNNQPSYVVPQNPLSLELIDLKREYRFVQIARKVAADDTLVATLEHDETVPPSIQMISKSKFDALVAGLDSGKTLPISSVALAVPVVSTIRRIVEFYHIILGLTLFPGEEDPGHEYIDTFGFQKKILDKGARNAIINESKTSNSSSQVTASKPIEQQGEIAAFLSTGAPLTVTNVVYNTGVITLSDNGSPVPNSSSVELIYESMLYVTVNVQDVNGKVIAVMLSQQLADYLAANQA